MGNTFYQSEKREKWLFWLRMVPGIFFVGFLGSCAGQIGDFLMDAGERVPSLNQVVGAPPPITTNIKNAVTQISFLDDFQPRAVESLAALDRGPGNGFILDRPGVFSLEIRSYCLYSGTYAPTKGEGYAYAPLAGPGAHFIRTVLQNSVDHSEIPQRHVQMLIWAILSRTRITDMSPELQKAAAILLSKQELDLIVSNALDELRDEAYSRLLRNLPEPARRVLEAEAELRSLLTNAASTYEDIERVAVLAGRPEPEDRRYEVKRGRWSYHPDGYFIRYFPRGYNHMQLEVSHPEPFLIDRDRLHRISRVRNERGNRIEITYRDDIPSYSVPRSSGLQAFAIESLRFIKVNAIGPEIVVAETAEWENPGWTLVGEVSKAGEPEAGVSDYPGLMQRYNQALSLVELFDRVEAGLRPGKMRSDYGAAQERARADLIDLAHLANALEKTVFPDLIARDDWCHDHALLLKKAWQYLFLVRQGKSQQLAMKTVSEEEGALAGGPFWFTSGGGMGSEDDDPCDYPPPKPENPPEVDPTDGVATPGDPGSQRLIGSASDGGPKKPTPDCQAVRDAIESLEKVRDAYQNNLPNPGEDGDEYDQRIHDLFNLGKPGGAVSPMGTSMNCTIRVNEAFYQGRPAVLREADCIHEKVHQAKCRWAREHADGGYTGWTVDPKNVRQNEIDAYNAGIKFLRDWLAKNGC